MVGPKTTAEDTSSYLRKIRKPMVEKQRRERMNNSISQLKSLIASTIKQNIAPMTRVDKADILELTVFHLMQLQRQQSSVTMATEVASYNSGFKDCARETVTYLSKHRKQNDITIRSLSNHLHTVYTTRSMLHDKSASMTSSQMSSGQKYGPQGSTPLRAPENLLTYQQKMNIEGYSPIPVATNVTHLFADVTHLPELTSSFVTDGLSDGQSSELSSFGSSWNSSFSANSSSESLRSSSGNTNSSTESLRSSSGNMVSSSVDLDIDVVSIGDGKENQIGHVIKEKIWRPF